MSKCYYVECNDSFINFKALQEVLQGRIPKDLTVKVEEYDPSEGQGGCFYIEKNAACGVHVFKEGRSVVVKIRALCNHYDYLIAMIILESLERTFEKNVIDEDGNAINTREYFTNERIENLRETNAMTVYTTLKTLTTGILQIPGVVRSVYFGKGLTKELSKYENDPANLADMFDSIMNYVQYGLPDYSIPSKFLVRPQGSENDTDMKVIRIIFEGFDYILQDYDYLAIPLNEQEPGVLFIDNNDLTEICSKIYGENDGFQIADDFTVVFPKLEGEKWQRFVELAKGKNHEEMQNAKPVAKTADLASDSDSEEEEPSYQYHGNHWDCVLSDPEKDFSATITTALENGELVGQNETDYSLDEDKSKKTHGKVFELGYLNRHDDSLSVRILIAALEDSNQVISMYPVVKDGALFSLKITEIKEWNNGLEGWITAEFPDEKEITFFDADYGLNKDKYEIGKNYNFIIGALSYVATEPETKGFKLEGQEAIDFKAKTGEAPDYDENGNVKPVEFSTENLCSFMQGFNAPDEAEYITVVDEVKSAKALGNSFWKFNIIYRGFETEDILIPTFVLKNDKNKKLNKASQIQGIVWLTGYLAG